MNDTRPAVGHLVTPYLFTTGSWIYAQLMHNSHFRAVVLTQRVVNRDVFPFDAVHDFESQRSGVSSLLFQVSKYLLGRFPARPYREAIEREGIGLLHAHQGWEGARTVHLRRRPGLPLVTSFYGRDATMLPRKAYWRCLYKRLFRDGDLFLAEGPHLAETLVNLGCPREKVRVVHLGVDLARIPFRERQPGPGGEQTGLIAASFREKKGIGYGLDAVARVAPRFPGLKIRVIGDGPLRPEIERRIARPDLAGRVELLGYLDFPRYLEEIERAHFLLAPSITARDGDCEGGAPVCILDAQAAGLPVLATTHCDIPEVTLPGRSALLSPERDVESLESNLDHLLADPRLWPGMGRAGRAHVEARFDILKQAEQIIGIYEELLD